MAILNLPIETLRPNPKNPRQNLGELSELATSIKNNGVMQNLTAVPNGDGTYTVVIGHRRLAAAKMAGLEEVPVSVVDLSEKEQQALMLTENMQRSDLTTYEQVHGIQMCLDLGMTIEDISEKTGLSRTAVGNRKRLLKFDQNKLKETLDAGTATMQDYLDLDHITDDAVREELINKHLGTPSFARYLREAQEDQKWRTFRYLAEKRLSQIAEKVEQIDWSVYESVQTWRKWDVKDEYQEIEIPDDYDEVKYLFTSDKWSVNLYKQRAVEEEDEEEDPDAELKRRWEEHSNYMESFFRGAELGREIFLERLAKMTEEEWISNYGSQIDKLVMRILYEGSITIPSNYLDYFADPDELETDGDMQLTEEAQKQLLKAVHSYPAEYAAFLLLYNEYQQTEAMPMVRKVNWFTGELRYDPETYMAKKYTNMYNFLQEYGYVMSKDEKMLLDGTHPVYKLPPEDE